MKKGLLILIGFISSMALTSCGYEDDFFTVGQIWDYETRSLEPNSTLTIVSIEKNEKYGVIVGVYIDNVNIQNMGGETIIHFLPFSKEALKKSVVRVKGYADNLPDFKDSYHQWKDKFNANQCNLFNYPVKQVIDTLQLNIEKAQ